LPLLQNVDDGLKMGMIGDLREQRGTWRLARKPTPSKKSSADFRGCFTWYLPFDNECTLPNRLNVC